MNSLGAFVSSSLFSLWKLFFHTSSQAAFFKLNNPIASAEYTDMTTHT